MFKNSGATSSEAEAHCNREDGNLVSFTDEREYQWLHSWLNKNKYEKLWIGLNKNNNGLYFPRICC